MLQRRKGLPFLPAGQADSGITGEKLNPGFVVQGVLGNWKILSTILEN